MHALFTQRSLRCKTTLFWVAPMHNNPTKRRSLPAITLLVLLSLVAAACGDDSETTTGDGAQKFCAGEVPIANALTAQWGGTEFLDAASTSSGPGLSQRHTGLESVSAVGYVDLADADQQLAQAIWENQTTGRSWG
jgi:hypothetical protein